MPQKTTKSGLFAKYGQEMQAAHEAHMTDETSYSDFGELPEGIENGIARLVDCKFDVFKTGDLAGEYFFYAAGVVVSPAEVTDKHNVTHQIEGKRTSIMEAMCPTPNRGRKTVDEHVAHVYNELRKLGVDTQAMAFEDLENTVAALKEAGPYFKFRTWKGEATPQFPNPRVNHQWNGATEWSPPDQGNGVQDSTGPAAPPPRTAAATPPAPTKAPVRPGAPQAGAKPNGASPSTAARPGVKPAAPPPVRPAAPPAVKPAPQRPATAGGKPAPAPKPPQAPKPAPAPKPTPAPPAEAPAFTDQGDIDTLIQRAEAHDADAQNDLMDLARAQGIDEETIKAAPDWVAAAALITEAGAGAVGEEAGAGDAWTPKSGDVYLYRKMNPRTKKPEDKATEFEVTAVDEAAQTCTIKSLDDPKVQFAKVGWNLLEVGEPA